MEGSVARALQHRSVYNGGCRTAAELHTSGLMLSLSLNYLFLLFLLLPVLLWKVPRGYVTRTINLIARVPHLFLYRALGR